MDFELKNIPSRATKPRDNGLTMVMDKGLSVRETEDFLSIAAEFTDLIKLGFGTAFVTSCLNEKLAVYRSFNVPLYLGGTLFEAYLIRDQFDDYLRLLDKLKITHAEVSDGSMDLPHDKKCEYISTLARHVTVMSEVGSKDEDKIIPPYKWINLMRAELEAGAWKVIGESRESGNVGIYRGSGEVRMGLVEEILTQIPSEKIIWEAPQKSQQVFFLKLLGSDANLGNIAPNEVLPVETLRLGLRADTFHTFLPVKDKVN